MFLFLKFYVYDIVFNRMEMFYFCDLYGILFWFWYVIDGFGYNVIVVYLKILVIKNCSKGRIELL